MEYRVTPIFRHCLPALALLASAALSGCVGVAVGAGATAGTAAMQERGLGTAIADTVIAAKINAAYLEHDIDYTLIAIKVHEGRVLLTGTAPKPQDRVAAVRYAWTVDGVSAVINEISVSDNTDILDLARDKWITTQLRVTITFDSKVKAINYAIDTVNGTVYLMGVAQNDAELSRVRNHARAIDYVRRVISHVRLKNNEQRPAKRR